MTLPLPPGLSGHCGPLLLCGRQEEPPQMVWVNYHELHGQFTGVQALRQMRGQTGAAPLQLSMQPPPAADDPAWLHGTWRSPCREEGLTLNWTPQPFDAGPLHVTTEEVAASLLLGWVRAGSPERAQTWGRALLKSSGPTSRGRGLARGLALPALSELLFALPEMPSPAQMTDGAPRFNEAARTLGFHALKALLQGVSSWNRSKAQDTYDETLWQQVTLSGLRSAHTGPLCAAWLMSSTGNMEVRPDFPDIHEWVSSSARRQGQPAGDELARHVSFQQTRPGPWFTLPRVASGQGVAAEDQQWAREHTNPQVSVDRFLPLSRHLPPQASEALRGALRLDDDLPLPSQLDAVRAMNWRQAHAGRLIISGAQAALWSPTC